MDLVLFSGYIKSKGNETSEPKKWNSAGRVLTKETVSYSTSARCVCVCVHMCEVMTLYVCLYVYACIKAYRLGCVCLYKSKISC